VIDADWNNAIWTVMYNFWSDPDMTVDDVISELKDERDAIFG
jgi:glucose/mannose transport system substrate-binding protein